MVSLQRARNALQNQGSDLATKEKRFRGKEGAFWRTDQRSVPSVCFTERSRERRALLFRHPISYQPGVTGKYRFLRGYRMCTSSLVAARSIGPPPILRPEIARKERRDSEHEHGNSKATRDHSVLVRASFRNPIRYFGRRQAAGAPSNCDVRFSNRPVGVKRFQTIHRSSVDVSRGLALLFGIGTRALPSWGSRTRWNNLYRGLAIKQTTDPSGHTNSPHPSSREGHHSTARWSSSSSYRIRSCTVLMPLRRLGSSGTRCRQPRCGA